MSEYAKVEFFESDGKKVKIFNDEGDHVLIQLPTVEYFEDDDVEKRVPKVPNIKLTKNQAELIIIAIKEVLDFVDKHNNTNSQTLATS